MKPGVQTHVEVERLLLVEFDQKNRLLVVGSHELALLIATDIRVNETVSVGAK